MKQTVSIQTRLILALLIVLPVVWLATSIVAATELYENINELYDTQMSQLARRLLTLPASHHKAKLMNLDDLVDHEDNAGEAEDKYMAFMLWDAQGKNLLRTRGNRLAYHPELQGFFTIKGEKNDPNAHCEDASCFHKRKIPFNVKKNHWRILYLTDPRTGVSVAVAQNLHMRHDAVKDAMKAQMMPWLMALMVLLLLLLLSIRYALFPLKQLSHTLATRKTADDTPLSEETPKELQPLVRSLNGLFKRHAEAIVREQRFTSDAAHELRSPLAALKVQTEVLAMSDDAQEQEIAIRNLHQGIERTEHLLEQLLTIARLDPMQKIIGEPVRWLEITEKVLQECHRKAREKHIHLQRTGQAEKALPIQGDALLLEIMLRNLIDNAIKYAPENSQVILDLSPNSVAVLDSGKGIPEEWLPKIKERFVRPSGQNENGSGLGLSIVESIAQLHNLRLILQNRPEGGLKAEIQKAA